MVRPGSGSVRTSRRTAAASALVVKDEADTSSSRVAAKKRRRKNESSSSSSSSSDSDGDSTTLSTTECAKKGIAYVWAVMTLNTSFKKTDFIKAVLPSKSNNQVYKEIITKVQQELNEVFGTTLVAINEQTHEVSENILSQGFSSIIMMSKLKVFHILYHDVYPHNLENIPGLRIRDFKREKAIRSLLFMYLGYIFMRGVEQGVDEGNLWQLTETLQIHELIQINQADFRKFLKAEYQTTLYLTNKETKDDTGALKNVHYFWGPRSHIEFSKWDVFYAIVKILKRRVTDFPAQIESILNSSEKQRAIQQMEDDEENGGYEYTMMETPSPNRELQTSTGESEEGD